MHIEDRNKVSTSSGLFIEVKGAEQFKQVPKASVSSEKDLGAFLEIYLVNCFVRMIKVMLPPKAL